MKNIICLTVRRAIAAGVLSLGVLCLAPHRVYAVTSKLSALVEEAIANGATFVGLIPKVPLAGNDVRYCPFETGVYMDDEDSNNQNRFTVGGAWLTHQNAVVGGFGRVPGGGARGRNSVIDYCQIPIYRLPPARVGYAVIAAQGSAALDKYGMVVFTPMCPRESFPFTRYFDNEDDNNTNQPLNDSRLFFPNFTYVRISSESRSGTLIHFCYVPPSNAPGTPELPKTAWIWDMDNQTWGYDKRDIGRDFMFLAAGTQLGGEFYQDNEDDDNEDKWSTPPQSLPHASAMRNIIGGGQRGQNAAWRFGWTGINPGIGKLEDGQNEQPSCLNPFANLECAGKWAGFAAQLWSAISE